MVFCNLLFFIHSFSRLSGHNPYFSRWFSAILIDFNCKDNEIKVTILILVDGFLQSKIGLTYRKVKASHNPYFSRWFSAIYYPISIDDFLQGHNPYFSRWFSAITI